MVPIHSYQEGSADSPQQKFDLLGMTPYVIGRERPPRGEALSQPTIQGTPLMNLTGCEIRFVLLGRMAK